LSGFFRNLTVDPTDRHFCIAERERERERGREREGEREGERASIPTVRGYSDI
jgi:hypothetical protein